ncbi:MAG: GGDEF domain-containing protein, partial [Pseudomonadota bacterium]
PPNRSSARARLTDWIRSARLRIAGVFSGMISERYILKQMVDTSPDVIFYKDREGRYLGINDTYRQVWNIGWSSIYGKTDFDMHDADVAREHQLSDEQVYNTGEVLRISGEAEVDRNAVQYFDVIKAPIKDRNNKVVGLVGVARDVSEMRTVENKLKQHNEFLEAFSELVLSLPSESDADIQFDRVLSAVCDLLEAQSGHLLEFDRAEQSWGMAATTDSRQRPAVALKDRHLQSDDVFTAEHAGVSYIGSMVRIDDQVRYCLLFQHTKCLTFVRLQSLNVLRQISRQFLIVFRQLSLLRQVNFQARYDQLTGLHNRWSFDRELQLIIETASRSNSEFAMFYIDLDDFKPINDQFNHATGDEVLRRVGTRLQGLFGVEAVCTRLGGDEFAVICRQTNNKQAAASAVATIEKELGNPIDIGNREFVVGSSIGMAMYPQDGKTEEQLLLAADRSMYAVKNARKTEKSVKAA